MSLVWLKNLIFRTPAPPPSPFLRAQTSNKRRSGGTERTPLLPSPSPPSPPTSTYAASSDLEASRPASPKTSEGFHFPRVDARLISDATIGLSDGLTVPFALTAGLSALGDTRVVIYGGLAELVAGAISMGLGGWLGAKSEL